MTPNSFTLQKYYFVWNIRKIYQIIIDRSKIASTNNLDELPAHFYHNYPTCGSCAVFVVDVELIIK